MQRYSRRGISREETRPYLHALACEARDRLAFEHSISSAFAVLLAACIAAAALAGCSYDVSDSNAAAPEKYSNEAPVEHSTVDYGTPIPEGADPFLADGVEMRLNGSLAALEIHDGYALLTVPVSVENGTDADIVPSQSASADNFLVVFRDEVSRDRDAYMAPLAFSEGEGAEDVIAAHSEGEFDMRFAFTGEWLDTLYRAQFVSYSSDDGYVSALAPITAIDVSDLRSDSDLMEAARSLDWSRGGDGSCDTALLNHLAGNGDLYGSLLVDNLLEPTEIAAHATDDGNTTLAVSFHLANGCDESNFVKALIEPGSVFNVFGAPGKTAPRILDGKWLSVPQDEVFAGTETDFSYAFLLEGVLEDCQASLGYVSHDRERVDLVLRVPEEGER